LFVRHYDYFSGICALFGAISTKRMARVNRMYCGGAIRASMPDEYHALRRPTPAIMARQCGAKLVILNKQPPGSRSLSSDTTSTSHGWSIWNWGR
jgi:hypothetical protein